VIAVSALILDTTAFLWTLLAVELLMGIAHGASEAPNRALTFASVAPSESGLAAGFLQLSQRLAATITIAAATGIFLSAQPGGKSGAKAIAIALALTAVLLSASLAASIAEQRATRAGRTG